MFNRFGLLILRHKNVITRDSLKESETRKKEEINKDVVKIAAAERTDVIIFTRHHSLNLVRVDDRDASRHSLIEEIDVVAECH